MNVSLVSKNAGWRETIMNDAIVALVTKMDADALAGLFDALGERWCMT